MIEIKNIEIMNFEGAFRGMRNPLESWSQSDSVLSYYELYNSNGSNKFLIGPKDLALAQKLIIAGSDHSKFMRQIFVSMDITAPLYWFKELETYKVGTVANSCSTMHKLASTPITKDCFSFDIFNDDWDKYHFSVDNMYGEGQILVKDITEATVKYLEELRLKYLETKDIRYWRALIQLLPSAWNQKRTWTADYQVLRNIYFARLNHKLTEWHDFCDMIEELPYGNALICVTKNDII